jgi:Uma2 family endonuclease
MVASKIVTAQELEERATEFEHFELVRGELIPISPSSGSQSMVASMIHGALFMHVFPKKMGQLFIAEGGFIVAHGPDSVLAPDVAFVRERARIAAVASTGSIPYAPDLAVEVESPSNRIGEMLTKVGIYLSGGTEAVWLVRPNHRTVTVFRPGMPERILTEGDSLDGGDVVPGFRLSLTDLFEGIPR